MHYRSGTELAEEHWEAAYHSPDGSTFLHKMTSWPPSWNYDSKSKVWFSQSMCIHVKNNPAKFHANPIWKNGILGIFEEVSPRESWRKTTRWPMPSRSVCFPRSSRGFPPHAFLPMTLYHNFYSACAMSIVIFLTQIVLFTHWLTTMRSVPDLKPIDTIHVC